MHGDVQLVPAVSSATIGAAAIRRYNIAEELTYIVVAHFGNEINII